MAYSVLPDEIINECRRRIEFRYSSVARTAVLGDGGDPAQSMLLEIERLRACADHLLAMSPIPVTYRSDHFWQGYPPGFRFMTQVVAAPVAAAAAIAPMQAPAPHVIVVNPGGGQQVVMGGQPMVQPGTQQPYATQTPYTHPQNFAPQLAPGVHFSAPPPEMMQQPYSPMPTGVVNPPAPAAHAPVPVRVPFPAAQPAASPVRGAQSFDVWDDKKEQMFRACVAALDGDAEMIELVTEFARTRAGLDLNTFAQRIISERATAKLIHGQIEEAA